LARDYRNYSDTAAIMVASASIFPAFALFLRHVVDRNPLASVAPLLALLSTLGAVWFLFCNRRARDAISKLTAADVRENGRRDTPI
jgi:hypothetical protein